jgi:hypothetical protein
MRRELIEKIAVTFELCGGVVLSNPAKAAIVSDLEKYTEKQVCDALDRCRSECKRLTQQDIISRIDDGRPGPQEAWGMIPTNEDASVVWTEEMAEAYGTIRSMTDPVAARMSFIEAYNAAVVKARAKCLPVMWSPSLGHDVHGRDRALVEAVEKGRLKRGSAMMLMARPEEMPMHLFPESDRKSMMLTGKTRKKTDVSDRDVNSDGLVSISEILRDAGF